MNDRNSVKGLGGRMLARRKEMAKASLDICPDLADKVSMDEVMEHVYGVSEERRRRAAGPGAPKGGLGGKPPPGAMSQRPKRRGRAGRSKGPVAPSPDLIVQALTVFAGAHAERYQTQLQTVQEARRQLEEQETELRQRCLDEFVQYVAFMLANAGSETNLDAVLDVCAPALTVSGTSVRQFKAAVKEALGG